MNINKLKKLQEIAREQGKFLSKCAENKQYPERKYMITYSHSSDYNFLRSLKEVRIHLRLEEYDGVQGNIK